MTTNFSVENGLLYLDTDELQTLSSDLSVAQPFIGRIAQQPNLTGFFSIFEDALKAQGRRQRKRARLCLLTWPRWPTRFPLFCIKRSMAKMLCFPGNH